MSTLSFTFEGLPVLGMTIAGRDLPEMTAAEIADVEQHVSKTLASKWGRASRTVSETGPVQLGNAAETRGEWDVDLTPTYYQSASGLTVTRERALKEVRDHGCDTAVFLAEVGDRDEYTAQGVLDWLGY